MTTKSRKTCNSVEVKYLMFSSASVQYIHSPQSPKLLVLLYRILITVSVMTTLFSCGKVPAQNITWTIEHIYIRKVSWIILVLVLGEEYNVTEQEKRCPWGETTARFNDVKSLPATHLYPNNLLPLHSLWASIITKVLFI